MTQKPLEVAGRRAPRSLVARAVLAAQAADSVCAVVKLEILQKATMERVEHSRTDHVFLSVEIFKLQPRLAE